MGRGTCAFPELSVDLFLNIWYCVVVLVALGKMFFWTGGPWWAGGSIFDIPRHIKTFSSALQMDTSTDHPLVLVWVSPVVAACWPRVCIKTCFCLNTIAWSVLSLVVDFLVVKKSCFWYLVTRCCKDGRKSLGCCLVLPVHCLHHRMSGNHRTNNSLFVYTSYITWALIPILPKGRGKAYLIWIYPMWSRTLWQSPKKKTQRPIIKSHLEDGKSIENP